MPTPPATAVAAATAPRLAYATRQRHTGTAKGDSECLVDTPVLSVSLHVLLDLLIGLPHVLSGDVDAESVSESDAYWASPAQMVRPRAVDDCRPSDGGDAERDGGGEGDDTGEEGAKVEGDRASVTVSTARAWSP